VNVAFIVVLKTSRLTVKNGNAQTVENDFEKEGKPQVLKEAFPLSCPRVLVYSQKVSRKAECHDSRKTITKCAGIWTVKEDRKRRIDLCLKV